MRFLFVAATLIVFACGLVTPAAAQDDYRLVLRLTIVTGDDDLRGGNDSVRGSYRIGSAWSTPVVLNRRGMRWPDRSRNTVNMDLPETILGLNAVRLQTNFGGGIGGDNWNMDQLYVQLCPIPASAGECLDLGRHGRKRFTASDGTLILTLGLPPPGPGLIVK